MWELPAPAHELLLGLALPPDLLKHTLEHAVSRERGINFRIGGSQADVLFAVVHDMTTRNCLSHAMHKVLDGRYTQAVRQWARLREGAALRLAFMNALGELANPASTGHAQNLPAMLWSALTHSCGAEVQNELLYAARTFVLQQVRQAQHTTTATGALREERDRLVSALNDARAANAQAHMQGQLQRLAHGAELAHLRGELARLQAAARVMLAQAPGPAASAIPATSATEPRPTRLRTQAPPQPTPQAPASLAMPSALAPAPPIKTPTTVAGRTVLCVGGITGAVQRYRALIESRGGRFVHHDGGIEDNLQRLHTQLSQADLVLCQAACINHEAYHCVKSHCKRSGTECVFIDRPSVSRFASVIATLSSPSQTAR
jgi:hypothetical protein